MAMRLLSRLRFPHAVILLLMSKSCSFDADHALTIGSASGVGKFEFPALKTGGGFEKSIASTYDGLGFRVLRTGRDGSECFPP